MLVTKTMAIWWPFTAKGRLTSHAKRVPSIFSPHFAPCRVATFHAKRVSFPPPPLPKGTLLSTQSEFNLISPLLKDARLSIRSEFHPISPSHFACTSWQGRWDESHFAWKVLFLEFVHLIPLSLSL